ncbi:hypothetical protein BLNAU_11298 [Blattamonas nauphoetae]|uniref:Uncharacterized protein n=1 Tax=Blattamonas nauphoetae TaxID=2049346 RepID=A0ABQ9XSK1_9EUKA|nr:hypothetical protein BLNAU_11298 [Blattamonas nauphoetae]
MVVAGLKYCVNGVTKLVSVACGFLSAVKRRGDAVTSLGSGKRVVFGFSVFVVSAASADFFNSAIRSAIEGGIGGTSLRVDRPLRSVVGYSAQILLPDSAAQILLCSVGQNHSCSAAQIHPCFVARIHFLAAGQILGRIPCFAVAQSLPPDSVQILLCSAVQNHPCSAAQIHPCFVARIHFLAAGQILGRIPCFAVAQNHPCSAAQILLCSVGQIHFPAADQIPCFAAQNLFPCSVQILLHSAVQTLLLDFDQIPLGQTPLPAAVQTLGRIPCFADQTPLPGFAAVQILLCSVVGQTLLQNLYSAAQSPPAVVQNLYFAVQIRHLDFDQSLLQNQYSADQILHLAVDQNLLVVDQNPLVVAQIHDFVGQILPHQSPLAAAQSPPVVARILLVVARILPVADRIPLVARIHDFVGQILPHQSPLAAAQSPPVVVQIPLVVDRILPVADRIPLVADQNLDFVDQILLVAAGRSHLDFAQILLAVQILLVVVQIPHQILLLVGQIQSQNYSSMGIEMIVMTEWEDRPTTI